MEFFVENWIWFLVGGVVILMTIIGYIAEKTDFGRKDIAKNEKNKKEESKKEEIETLEIEETKPEVQMSLATDAILENNDEFVYNPVETEDIEYEIPEELKVPFGETSTEESNLDSSDDNVEEIVAEEPVEQINITDIPTQDIELPDLENVISEEENEEEDVWKF